MTRIAVLSICGLLTAGCSSSTSPTGPENPIGGLLCYLFCVDIPDDIGPGSEALPVPVLGGHRYGSIFAASERTCGLTVEGAGHCWGDGAYGVIGHLDHSTGAHVPVPVSGGHLFQSLALGTSHTCGLTMTGAVHCWGKGTAGQLGNGGIETQTAPVAVVSEVTFESLASGDERTCGVTVAEETYCWGNVGPSGFGTGVNWSIHTLPLLLSTAPRFTSVSVGRLHTCGLTSGGDAYCWGILNNDGQLGNGSTTSSLGTAVPVSGGLKFASVSAGDTHTCGLTTDGKAYCWGESSKLGSGASLNQHTPASVSGGLTFATIRTGYHHTCGLTVGGRAYCWGAGGKGQLGDGTHQDRGIPVAVGGGLVFKDISVGSYHSCGLTVEGDAYCWGDATYRQLGHVL